MDVKICGITRREDAEAAARAGADYLGFVLAESPRQVEPPQAGRLIGGLEVTGVGVFVDRTPEAVAEAAGAAGLDAVQLHGSEPPEACRRLRSRGFTVWKALRPRSAGELDQGVRRYADHADALLVEGYSPDRAGGTGTGFPYRWLEELDDRESWPPLVLAGGLTADTVAEAVRRIRPVAVDVSSGVERRPGIKDPGRIHAFVAAARSAAASAGERPARLGER